MIIYQMLSLLLIIGVLSITGILGYQFALNKYRTNKTLNELQIRAVHLSQNDAKNRTDSM